MNWTEAQKWEADWHGNCVNTLGEELKQRGYATRMGLAWVADHRSPWNIDLAGKSVVDIGGGPCSLLLKTINAGRRLVVEPMVMPVWIAHRYAAAGIELWRTKGEDFADGPFNEAWLYNVLCHVENPQAIVNNARAAAKVVRVFEWIDTRISPGHLHTLTETTLNAWLGGEGKVTHFTGLDNLFGHGYHGVFVGDAK